MRVQEAWLGRRRQSLSGAVSPLQQQLPHGASKHLAPTQCQALEARAEELSPTPRSLSEGRVGEGRAKASCLPSPGSPGRELVFFPANPSGGPRCSEVPSPTPRKQFFRAWGHVTLGTRGN